MQLAITVDGKTEHVTATPGDLVRLERQFNIAASQLDENTKLEYVLFLGYSALKRTGKYEGTFDEFLDVVESTEEDDAPKA